MAGTGGRTPRERYRAQVRDEAKRLAWEQIAAAGPSALSLNALARRLGMTGPALYRYFAGRDALLAELIRDACRDLTATLRAGAAAGAGPGGLAEALRAWALAHPQRYFLLYGTPVPGREAPESTRRVTGEITAVLLDACGAAGPPDAPGGSPAALRRALAFWTRLHGVLSLELAGHFTGMGFDPAELYGAETASLPGEEAGRGAGISGDRVPLGGL
ncbi:TetR/AcrR family transcriptional regulator [Streptomyces sp. LP11]|uniref:TetR/AcrR family transcriptional regulator n=1 Tax=Streptomyces pyxinicus TaxID=2970331 RepID=A0ABT2B4F3_9ACTN|nr:TetR/AcrR family transcriptional regulator [Streptomyces sp. LP11]MCS0602823.1 TetR/AcrR family transcriptional regulator [Streptomyces sp. LP11]